MDGCARKRSNAGHRGARVRVVVLEPEADQPDRVKVIEHADTDTVVDTGDPAIRPEIS